MRKAFEIIDHTADVGIIAYSPLASGVLTGKYDKNTQFKDWRGKGIIGVFSGEEYVKNIAKVDRLKDVVKSLGKTCGQTAINWVTRQPGLTTALIGVKNARQMEENIQSVGWQPNAEQMQSMDEIFQAETNNA